MKIIFIAGPYFSGGNKEKIEQNIRAAEKYQIALANAHVPFFCAHNHTEHFEEKAKAPEVFYKRMDMEILKRACDGVLAIPSWETSSGAKEEVKWAQQKGMPVFFAKSPSDLDKVINWAKS
jgi:hypothetical protein